MQNAQDGLALHHFAQIGWTIYSRYLPFPKFHVTHGVWIQPDGPAFVFNFKQITYPLADEGALPSA
jgi:hypothetical protein